jgi:hypothetical protein
MHVGWSCREWPLMASPSARWLSPPAFSSFPSASQAGCSRREQEMPGNAVNPNDDELLIRLPDSRSLERRGWRTHLRLRARDEAAEAQLAAAINSAWSSSAIRILENNKGVYPLHSHTTLHCLTLWLWYHLCSRSGE